MGHKSGSAHGDRKFTPERPKAVTEMSRLSYSLENTLEVSITSKSNVGQFPD